MQGILSLGRVPYLCILLFCSLRGCRSEVIVTVTPTVEAMMGETTTLPCSFTITPPSDNAIVEWFIEEPGARVRVAYMPQSGGAGGPDTGTKLSGRVSVGQDFSLSISPVQVEDERSFHCQVTAGAAGAMEGTTQLKVFNVPDKPEVNGLPEFITVPESSPSEIGQCVSRNGQPEPRLIWYKDSSPLEEIKDVNDKMYMVSSVVREVTGLYTMFSTLFLRVQKEDRTAVFHCRVQYTSPNGLAQHKDSENFTLPLFYPTEQVTLALVNSDPVKEGDNVQIKCEADGNPKPDYIFTFKKEGKDEEQRDAPEGVVTISSVTREDAGLYRCEALDFDASPESDLVKELTLTVHYIDSVTISPTSPATVPLDEKVELTCDAKASDQHSVLWKKESSELANSGTFVIEKATFENSGVYTCVVTVPSVPGLEAQGNVTVNVAGKPVIAAPSDSMVGKEGEMATLTCSAQGYPAPQFTWKPSGKESVTLKGNEAIGTVQLNATAAVLEGGVICEATNEYGADSKQLKVVIGKVTATEGPSGDRADKQAGNSSGVVIAVVLTLLFLLLLALLLFFLWRKKKLCFREEKKGEEGNNGAAVEMSADRSNEEKGLLNKTPAADQ